MKVRDLQLVARCLSGDDSAFDALYTTHAGRVKIYFLRSGFAPASADDLTQETFIRVARSMGTFDARRGNFRTWLTAIARNIARKQWSRRVQPENFDPEMAEEMIAGTDNPAMTSQANEELDGVRHCVEQLPDELRHIVRLRYVDGMTTRGIGEAIKMPEATVRLRLDEARSAVERCLRSKGVFE